MAKPMNFPYDEIRWFFPVLGSKYVEGKAYFWILTSFSITFYDVLLLSPKIISFNLPTLEKQLIYSAQKSSIFLNSFHETQITEKK